MTTYEIKQWTEAAKTKAQIASGDETQEPRRVEPKVDGKTTRPGKRTEYYSVNLTTTSGEPKTYNKQVNFEEWKDHKKGRKVKAAFYSTNGESVVMTPIN